MPFQDGNKHSAGRKKGSKNKRTLIFSQILEKMDVSLPKEIFKILREGDLSDEKRADVLLKLCEFVYPKITSVQIDDPDDEEENEDPREAEIEKETHELLEEIRKNGAIS